MYKIEKSVLVMHSAEKIFNLIDAVELYPEFLPWCGGTQVHARDEVMTEATIRINYHGLKQQFRTRNTKVFAREMQMHFIEGPFKTLKGEWQFVSLQAHACRATFKLEYAFSNILLEKAIAPVFSQIANTFVDSFVRRADEVK